MQSSNSGAVVASQAGASMNVDQSSSGADHKMTSSNQVTIIKAQQDGSTEQPQSTAVLAVNASTATNHNASNNVVLIGSGGKGAAAASSTKSN